MEMSYCKTVIMHRGKEKSRYIFSATYAHDGYQFFYFKIKIAYKKVFSTCIVRWLLGDVL